MRASLELPSSPALALPFLGTERTHQGSLTDLVTASFFSLFLTVAGRSSVSRTFTLSVFAVEETEALWLHCPRVQDCPRVGWSVNCVM